MGCNREATLEEAKQIQEAAVRVASEVSGADVAKAERYVQIYGEAGARMKLREEEAQAREAWRGALGMPVGGDLFHAPTVMYASPPPEYRPPAAFRPAMFSPPQQAHEFERPNWVTTNAWAPASGPPPSSPPSSILNASAQQGSLTHAAAAFYNHPLDPAAVAQPAGKYRYQMDGVGGGRPISAEGWLARRVGDRLDDREAMRMTRAGLEGFDAGHLIASMFDGAKLRFNLVPQASDVNRIQIRKFEEGLKARLKDGEQIYLQVHVVYRDADPDSPPAQVVFKVHSGINRVPSKTPTDVVAFEVSSRDAGRPNPPSYVH